MLFESQMAKLTHIEAAAKERKENERKRWWQRDGQGERRKEGAKEGKNQYRIQTHGRSLACWLPFVTHVCVCVSMRV